MPTDPLTQIAEVCQLAPKDALTQIWNILHPEPTMAADGISRLTAAGYVIAPRIWIVAGRAFWSLESAQRLAGRKGVLPSDVIAYTPAKGTP